MERQSMNSVSTTTKQRQGTENYSAQDDFPILLESELPPDTNYCIECGKVHQPGECNNANE